MSTTDLPKCLRKHADKIQEISDERGGDDGYWVYLVPGWLWQGETHCVHEDTPMQCAQAMKSLRPCTIPNCCNVAAN